MPIRGAGVNMNVEHMQSNRTEFVNTSLQTQVSYIAVYA